MSSCAPTAYDRAHASRRLVACFYINEQSATKKPLFRVMDPAASTMLKSEDLVGSYWSSILRSAAERYSGESR